MNKVSIIVVVAAAGLIGCGHSAPDAASAHDTGAPLAVRAFTAAERDWPAVYETTGTVRARTAAVLSAKVMGYVREVKISVGDRVRAGQKLVLLDSRDLEAGYRQAEAARAEARSALPEVDNAIAGARANLDLAEVTFKRMEGLFAKHSVSNQEFDEAAMRLKVARAGHQMALAKREQLASKIEQAEQALASAAVAREYALITAPFDGVVTEKPVQPGSLAAPGQPLLTIEQATGFRFEATIEESKLGAVRLGQTVSISFDAIGQTLSGRVAEIVPAVDAASRSFIAKVDLPAAPGLRSGIFGRARFPLGSRRALTVPAGALTERGQLTSVYVAEDGRARARLVTIGQRSADGVEVLSGLTPGDRIIAPLPTGIADGIKVEVRP